jgi:hypothetical protein
MSPFLSGLAAEVRVASKPVAQPVLGVEAEAEDTQQPGVDLPQVASQLAVEAEAVLQLAASQLVASQLVASQLVASQLEASQLAVVASRAAADRLAQQRMWLLPLLHNAPAAQVAECTR